MANTDSTYPLWADELRTYNAVIANPENSSTTIYGSVTPSTINLTNVSNSNNYYMDLSSSVLNFSTSDHKLSLTASALTVNGAFDISASSITLNGTAAPSTDGQALIANDANGGLKWFTITDLLNLEAGVFVNNANAINADITFAQTYGTPPAVVITPDCGANGRIIPVSLAGVTTTGFSALFGSNKLTKFNFVVLPVNSTYSINNASTNFSSSELNESSDSVPSNSV
jgi:hypothetical protein